MPEPTGFFVKKSGTLYPAATIPGPQGIQGEKGDPGSLGGSSNYAGNLNAAQTPGLYWIGYATASNASNNSPTVAEGYLHVQRYSTSGYVVQTYIEIYKGQLWSRGTSTGSNWSVWRRASSSNFDTLSGTGSPEGSQIAPVGTTYIDTAATNGAIEWTKFNGTGNTGWRVTKGDTGWRNVSSMNLFQAINYITHILLRREGATCHLAGRLSLSQSGLDELIQVPAGFRPYQGSTAGALIGYNTPLPVGHVKNSALYNSRHSFYLNSAVSGDVYFNLVWPLDTRFDSWPTSLPGTAA